VKPQDNVKIIKNFLSEEDCQKYINFIDKNLDRFNAYSGNRYPPKRFTIRFGRDDEFPQEANFTFEKIEEIKEDLAHTITGVVSVAESLMRKRLYLTSFFLSKNIPGSFLSPHRDAGHPTENNHLDYNALIYLNTLVGNGQIVFPDWGVEIEPELGDLVIFDTKDPMATHLVKEVTQDRYTIPIWLTVNKENELPFI
jgi:hypothetical protein